MKDLTPAQQIIYDALYVAANEGVPCPDNAKLAKLANYSQDKINKVLRNLVDRKYILSQVAGGYRVVHILATGKSTLRSTKPGGSWINDAAIAAMQARKGSARHHEALINLYGRMARERGVSVTTAMLHAQHGRERVEAVGA